MKVSKKETQLTASDRLPYEKFLQKGAESLSDAELLAIMLRTGPDPGPDAPQAFRDCPALALAEQVLSLPLGSRSGLLGLSSLSCKKNRPRAAQKASRLSGPGNGGRLLQTDV